MMKNVSGVDITVLSFDIDNTLIDLKTLSGGFSSIWDQFTPEPTVVLTYNTGRLYADVLNLIDQKIIPRPDFIIGGVGTHIYDVENRKELTAFADLLSEGWNLSEVEKIMQDLNFDIDPQPLEYQHTYKRSYFFYNAGEQHILDIESKFKASPLEVNVVYSGQQYLDILPKRANKGNALNWLLKYLGKSVENALVAGDSGNDVAMFELESVHGILVSNASDELSKTIQNGSIFRASQPRHVGVVEGLVFHNLMPDEALQITLSEFEQK